MNLSQAQTLAVSLMKEHGIWQQGWRFEFDNAVKRFGVCKYRSKTIGLSAKLVGLNEQEQVKDTILHEIAHAIAGYKAGHGVEWKMVCIRIGAKPERCYSSADTTTPLLKYYAECGGCGKRHEKARLKLREVRRSCMCQSGKDWNDRVLLEFRARY
jgi:predicted SprT family Zn-dependent metalloprotease